MAGQAVLVGGLVRDFAIHEDAQALEDLDGSLGVECRPGFGVRIAFDPQRVLRPSGSDERRDACGGSSVAC